MRRQAITSLRASAVALACAALLAACGGGGDDESASQAQIIDFPYPGVRYLGTTPEPLNATTTSGLAVTFSSNSPAVCQISEDGRLVPVAVGECSITASQAGNGQYIAAAPAQQLFTILRSQQTIAIESPGFQALNLVPAPLVASASSGLAVQLTSLTPTVCGVNGTQLMLVGPGTCTIEATQPGSAEYDPASPRSITFTVGEAPPPVLTLLSGYQSVNTYAGSNKDGWWCSDPNWCARTVSGDGSSVMFRYWIQPNDPAHPNTDNWIGAYFGLEALAEGVGSISTSGNTAAGVQVDKQSALKFSLGQNAEWFATSNRSVKVVLVLGHFNLKNGSACNVSLSTTFTPATAAVRPYELQLSDFTAIDEACSLAGLNAAVELHTYPIVKIKFEAAGTNTSVARTPDTNPNPPTYPTEITLTGPVTVE